MKIVFDQMVANIVLRHFHADCEPTSRTAVDKKVDKKIEKKVGKKVEKKVGKNVEKKVGKNVEKKVEKNVEKKVEKKVGKPLKIERDPKKLNSIPRN